MLRKGGSAATEASACTGLLTSGHRVRGELVSPRDGPILERRRRCRCPCPRRVVSCASRWIRTTRSMRSAAPSRTSPGSSRCSRCCERILQRAVGLLGGDAGSICTVDEQAGTYRKEADLGVECQEGRVFPLDRGRDRCGGAASAARWCSTPTREVRGGHVVAADRDRLHATVAVPIEWAGSIIGACVVFSTDPDQRFTDRGRRAAEPVRQARRRSRSPTPGCTPTPRNGPASWRSANERERVVRDVHDTVARALGSILRPPRRRRRPAVEPTTSTAARDAARSALAETRRTVLGLGARAARAALARRRDRARAGLGALGQRPAHRPGGDRRAAGDRARGRPAGAADGAGGADQRRRSTRRRQQVRVGVFYGADDVVIVVEDDGCGFDVERAHRCARAKGSGSTASWPARSQLGADLRDRVQPRLGHPGPRARAVRRQPRRTPAARRSALAGARRQPPTGGARRSGPAAGQHRAADPGGRRDRRRPRRGRRRARARARRRAARAADAGPRRRAADVLHPRRQPGRVGAADGRRPRRRAAARRDPRRRARLRRLRHRRSGPGPSGAGVPRAATCRAHRERAAAVRRVGATRRRDADRARAAGPARWSSRACRTSRSPPGWHLGEDRREARRRGPAQDRLGQPDRAGPPGRDPAADAGRGFPTRRWGELRLRSTPCAG